MKVCRDAVILFVLAAISCGCTVIAPAPQREKPKLVFCEKVKSPLEIIVASREAASTGERFSLSFAGIFLPGPEDRAYRLTMEYLRQLEGKELLIEQYGGSRGQVVALVSYKAPHKHLAEYGNDREYPVLVNSELLEKGYAGVNRSAVPEDYRAAFISKEDRAKFERRGMWSRP